MRVALEVKPKAAVPEKVPPDLRAKTVGRRAEWRVGQISGLGVKLGVMTGVADCFRRF